jgi:hypothetical protein
VVQPERKRWTVSDSTVRLLLIRLRAQREPRDAPRRQMSLPRPALRLLCVTQMHADNTTCRPSGLAQTDPVRDGVSRWNVVRPHGHDTAKTPSVFLASLAARMVTRKGAIPVDGRERGLGGVRAGPECPGFSPVHSARALVEAQRSCGTSPLHPCRGLLQCLPWRSSSGQQQPRLAPPSEGPRHDAASPVPCGWDGAGVPEVPPPLGHPKTPPVSHVLVPSPCKWLTLDGKR